MADHLSQTQLAGYCRRTLNAEELVMADRHLAACQLCHERLIQISGQSADPAVLVRLSPEEPFHLDYEQHLAAYVDGTLNDIDREIVESHLALCSSCTEDLRDVQEFSRQPGMSLAHEEKPLAQRRWWATWQWSPWTPQLTAALVIVGFLLALVAAFVFWTTNRTSKPVQQAGPTASPELDPQNPVVKPTTETVAGQPSPEQQDDRRNQSTGQRERPLIALNDAGRQITLDPQGHLSGLDSMPDDLRQAVESALVYRKLQLSPSVAELSERSGRLRDGGASEVTFLPVAPVGIVIESDRPTFSWRALEKGGSYSVTIFDSSLRSIENSGPLEATQWRPSRPLQRGVTYTWQIRVVKDGVTVISPKPPAPEARFRVLDQSAVTTLANLKRAHGNSHLALGVFYWKHGLMDKAESEFESLLRANRDSPVALQLLASLRAQRRR